MDTEFWQTRWNEGRIPFHRDEVNPHLRAHGPAVLGNAARIVVPLSGKSRDLPWLAQQAQIDEVVGVELVQAAVEAFHEELGLQPERDRVGEFERYRAGALTSLQGDIFALPAAAVGPFDGVWDRAALIALPPPQRRAYVGVLHEVLRPGGSVLLVTLEYDQSQMDGPPFAVSEGEVRAHFESWASIECLERNDVLEGHRPFRERGLTALHEAVYRLHKA